MSASHSASTTSTQQPGQAVHAGASAHTAPTGTILVAGQSGDSVNVQSQLATSTVAGDVSSRSNVSQVIGDLGAHHASSGLWLDQENAKVSAWGANEIERILQQTKSMEEMTVLGAKEKQRALDAAHSGEIAKLVQALDLRKAAELKELEDGLQRDIQSTLTKSKAEINRIESEMNERKMQLLKQSQLKSAKEIDALSNLVVETHLVPSQTRTVIETNTETGSVIAVATGGHIATGSATAESYSSQKIAAAPTAGVIGQQSDVKVGELRRDADNRKVGDAAIVSTMTGVTAAQPHVQGQQQHTAAHAAAGAHQQKDAKHIDAAYGSKINPITGRSEPTSTDATRRI